MLMLLFCFKGGLFLFFFSTICCVLCQTEEITVILPSQAHSCEHRSPNLLLFKTSVCKQQRANHKWFAPKGEELKCFVAFVLFVLPKELHQERPTVWS